MYKMKIQDIQVKDVMSVYSGIAGRCCCGCAGKHTYNSKYVNQASEHRGYEVRPEEVSDRTVALILNKVKKNADSLDVDVPRKGFDFFSVTVGNRLYVVYLVPELFNYDS